jgi:hypothetical protein
VRTGTPTTEISASAPENIPARLTPRQAQEVLQKPYPVFIVTLDGEIRAYNLLACWLTLEPGSAAEDLQGQNIFDLCTKALATGQLPVFFNQSLIRKKRAVLKQRAQGDRLQRIDETLEKAKVEQRHDFGVWTDVDQQYGKRRLWKYPLRFHAHDEPLGVKLLEFKGQDARIRGLEGFVITLEPAGQGDTDRVVAHFHRRLPILFPLVNYVLPKCIADDDRLFEHNLKTVTSEHPDRAFVPFAEQIGTCRHHQIFLTIDFPPPTAATGQPAPCCNSPVENVTVAHRFGWGDGERLECVVRRTPALACACGLFLEDRVVEPIVARAAAIEEYFEFQESEAESRLSEFLGAPDIAKVRDFALALRAHPWFVSDEG